MKRYISAILIPCFLLQLFGCCSYREMSIEELKRFKRLMNLVRVKLITGIIAVIAIGVYLVSQLPPRMDFTHLFGTPSK